MGFSREANVVSVCLAAPFTKQVVIPMKHLLSLVASLAGTFPALAQQAPANSPLPRYRHCPCCRHDTTTVTQHNNRTNFLAGLGVGSDQRGRAYVGIGLEAGHAFTPRLTVGGRGWLSFPRNSASNYGYDAGAPALAIHSLAGAVRYQFLDARRWRLEAVGSLGAGAVQLYDRNQTVVSYSRYGRTEQAATVFFSVHPLVEGGAGLTYKAGRQFWLSTRLSYQYLPGTGGLGTAGEFSGWQASVYATMPWGRR